MSQPLHPHWHTTDDAEEVSVTDVSLPSATQATVATVSRKPAAIAGIALVIGMITFFIQGTGTLSTQVGSTVQVSIADSGMEPQSISVQPGDHIVWTNNQRMPQYLLSDTLCTTDDTCLNTPTLFEGDTAQYIVAEGTTPGTYTYFSPTDPSISGTITVLRAGGNPVPPSTLPPPAPVGNPVLPLPLQSIGDVPPDFLNAVQRQFAAQQLTPPSPPTSSPQQGAPALSEQDLAMALPRNPYTVDGNRQHPFDEFGAPIPEAFGDAPGSTTYRPPVAYQRPYNQPETGAGLWIVLLASTGMLLLTARRQLVAYRSPS